MRRGRIGTRRKVHGWQVGPGGVIPQERLKRLPGLMHLLDHACASPLTPRASGPPPVTLAVLTLGAACASLSKLECFGPGPSVRHLPG